MRCGVRRRVEPRRMRAEARRRRALALRRTSLADAILRNSSHVTLPSRCVSAAAKAIFLACALSFRPDTLARMAKNSLREMLPEWSASATQKPFQSCCSNGVRPKGYGLPRTSNGTAACGEPGREASSVVACCPGPRAGGTAASSICARMPPSVSGGNVASSCPSLGLPTSSRGPRKLDDCGPPTFSTARIILSVCASMRRWRSRSRIRCAGRTHASIAVSLGSLAPGRYGGGSAASGGAEGSAVNGVGLDDVSAAAALLCVSSGF